MIQGNAQRPEVRIVSWNSDELTMDALPVHGFEHYKAKDYSLAHAPFPGLFFVWKIICFLGGNESLPFSTYLKI